MNSKELKYLLSNDEPYFTRCLKIVNKEGELIPFKLNFAQKMASEIIADMEKKGKPVRLIILKARQLGLSTYTEGYIFRKTTTQKHKKSIIIAHEEPASANLYNMYKRFYENLPDVLRPMKKYSNSSELVFENPTTDETEKTKNPGLMSKVAVKTAKNTKSGRSDTVQYLHASEVAFWEDPKTLMTGLMQTIPNKPNTAIILESTANGVGDYFYDMWQRAESGENAFYPLFIPWFVDPEYRQEFDSETERDQFIESVNNKYTDSSGREVQTYEYELIQYAKEKFSIDLSYEQLNWRVHAIKNNCNGDEEQFKQEYPAYPQEAFISTGRPVFNTKSLQEYLRQTEEGISGNLSYDLAGNVRFDENEKGYLTIFNKPKQGKYYSIGADVAEGLIEGDFSTACVGNNIDMNVDCVFHGHIDPDLFGTELVKLAKYYNQAYIGIENNNHGLTTIKSVQRLDYHNIYYTKTYDKITDKITQKVGWSTTGRTKPLMIDKLAEFIREKYIGIKHKKMISELLTYIKDEKGGTNAQLGCHDDLVICLAIWLQLVLEGRGDNYQPEVPKEDSGIRIRPDKFRQSYYDDYEEYGGGSLNEEYGE